MAYTYNGTPVLSKFKIGDTTYWLKDHDVRTILDTFGDVVTYNIDTTVTEAGTGLATTGVIHQFVADYVTQITGGAMSFAGIFEAVEGKTAEEVLAENVPNPVAGNVAIVGTAEYVYAGDKWNLYGDEGVYATVAGVEAEYVKKTLTIAGIDLADAITADELKTALGLGALAYKDEATGNIEVITGINDATYTPAGTVALAKDEATGVPVSGVVSAPTITVTPNTTEIQPVTSVGTLPTYTPAEYTAPTVTEVTSDFATAGMVAAVDGGDPELLVFTAATTEKAVTGTGFNAGSYTAAEFNAGALPELGAAQAVVTGIQNAEASVPTFTGDKFAATFTGTEATIAHETTSGTKTVTVS